MLVELRRSPLATLLVNIGVVVAVLGRSVIGVASSYFLALLIRISVCSASSRSGHFDMKDDNLPEAIEASIAIAGAGRSCFKSLSPMVASPRQTTMVATAQRRLVMNFMTGASIWCEVV